MLDTHQLNVFLKASETLNFTRAAKQLQMTQPSVSQHIQSLERHFNIQLFLRVGNTLQLTEAGMALVPLAREMINHSIHIDETISSLKGEVIGNLIVGCSTTPGKYILPKILAKFHQLYPKVTVTCQVAPQTAAMESLCAGLIHFTLAGYTRESPPDVEVRKFYSDQILLIAPLGHPWAKKKKIQLKDLFQGEFILREEESGTYQNIQDAFRNNNLYIEELKSILTLGNSEAIALAVKEEIGVGFVSQSVISSMGNNGFKIIEIEDFEIGLDIYIGRLNQGPKSKAQLAFWEFITKHYLVKDEYKALEQVNQSQESLPI